MAKDTKEKNLAAALDMFSKYGFAGTNIRELAGSLGMGKLSMYRHFESKEDIWNALLDELIAYYEARFDSPEHLPPVPASLEELASLKLSSSGGSAPKGIAKQPQGLRRKSRRAYGIRQGQESPHL